MPTRSCWPCPKHMVRALPLLQGMQRGRSMPRATTKPGKSWGHWKTLLPWELWDSGSFGIVGAFKLLLTRTIEDRKSQEDKLQRCFTLCLQEQPKMKTSLVCLCLCLISTAFATPVSMAFPGFPACCWKCEVCYLVHPGMLSAVGKHGL